VAESKIDMDKEEIKKLRKKAGLTQTQLAEITGDSLRSVQYWESGCRNIEKFKGIFLKKELEKLINS
jgi:DNA-binding transcriptional regulator YiaG